MTTITNKLFAKILKSPGFNKSGKEFEIQGSNGPYRTVTVREEGTREFLTVYKPVDLPLKNGLRDEIEAGPKPITLTKGQYNRLVGPQAIQERRRQHQNNAHAEYLRRLR